MPNIPRHRAIGTRCLLLGPALAFVLSSGALPAGPVQESGFRVYREKNAQGEEILHITNLDDSGRRIGGELKPAAQPVPIVAPQCTHEHEAGLAAPVIVNIYHSASIEGSDEACQQDDFACYERAYARFAAPYYRHRPAGHDRRAAPPEGLFGRPRVIDTRPYSRATASQRNRRYFRRN